jgi:GT2 family glycosyltransferase
MQANLPSLSISCVYYDTDLEIFRKTINSLLESVNYAKERQVLSSAELHLINNNSDKSNEFLIVVHELEGKFDSLVVHNGHGNIGYGRGNNLAISKITSTYHLILNPDVYQQSDALFVGIERLENNHSVGMLAPYATNQHGEMEYLAKRQPTFFVLLLRAMNKPFLNKIFQKKLDWYTYKDKINTGQEFPIELASGCYMLIRTESLKKVGGFSDKYFLYFEDFDLSRRINKFAVITYCKAIKIIHYGGNSSNKGISHIMMFSCSLLRYTFRQ